MCMYKLSFIHLGMNGIKVFQAKFFLNDAIFILSFYESIAIFIYP